MQNKKGSILLLMLLSAIVIAGYGCSSSKKNNKQNNKSEAAKQDTLMIRQNDRNDYKKMSPDHVAIKGHVLMVNENKPEVAVIKIDEVLGYGSGTPMLAAGQQINASFSNASVSDTTKGTDIKSLLTSGNTMIFILNHTAGKMIGTPGKGQPDWRINTIKQ